LLAAAFAEATALLLCLLAALPLAGCITASGQASYGVQSEHTGYVPARIAIFPCRRWPARASYQDLPLSNVQDTAVTELCQEFDTFVVDGFSAQPFMKGYSPKYVEKALGQAESAAFTADLDRTWRREAGDCRDCRTPPAYYKAQVAARPAWRRRLDDVSNHVHGADAVLLPFVTYTTERHYDDRGVAVTERAAGVALLLIDTDTGDLIWAGGREAAVPSKRFVAGDVTNSPPPPLWSAVADRLLVEDLWREFPGRQTN